MRKLKDWWEDFVYWLTWTDYKIAKCGFPYPEGWGVYKEHRWNGRRVITDSGLTKKQAEGAAALLNL